MNAPDTLRELQELSFLHEVAQLASSTRDWDEMLRIVIDRTTSAMHAEVASLYLMERAEGILRLAATNGLDRRGIGRVTLRVGEGVTGWVARARVPLAVRDVRNEPRWKRIPRIDADRYTSMLSVPVIARDEVIGVINLQTIQLHEFSREEIGFLQTIANNVAGIIEKGRLQRDAERKLREVSALFEVSNVLTSTLDLPEVLRLVVARLVRVFPGSSAAILLRDESGAAIERASAGEPSKAALAAGRLAVTEARQVMDAEHIALPLLAGQRMLGSVVLHVPGQAELAPEEAAFVGALANQAALAIDKASLFALERKTTEGLKVLERARAELIAVVTHDLRTPLSVIRGHLDLLAERNGSRDGTRDAIEQVHRLDGLVDRIIESVREELPDLAVRRRRFDLRRALAAALGEAAPLARHHRLSFPRSGTALWALGDRRRTGEVVAGLVHNATKYAPAGTRISVRISRGKGRAIVRVGDQGPGVKPEDRRRIFEPFVRAGDSSAVPGSGIGLYASRRVVESQGGDIWYEDAPGGGSVFAFSVPLAKVAAGKPS